MNSNILFSIFFVLNGYLLQAQSDWLSKEEVSDDLEFLTEFLNEQSSYVYLNGYDFNQDFDNYLASITDSTRLEHFGLFLTKTLAKIGDRHASMATIRGYRITEANFLPFMYAPLYDRVVVLDFNKNQKRQLLTPNFPYLKRIDNMDIDTFLQKTRPEDVRAPRATYFTLSVRDIRDIQKNYLLLNEPLPEEVELTLTDATFNNDTTFLVSLVNRSKRLRPWDDEFEAEYLLVKDEDYNNPEVVEQLFSIEDSIAYVKIPSMTDKEEAPLLFDKVNAFMQSVNDDNKALIIDVRANTGGTRDLLYEFASYLVHPDSIYVINATKQRATLPLSEEYVERLHSRFLYAYAELNPREQEAVTAFLASFDPIYKLDDTKFSAYYYGLLNGKKLAKESYHYSKPVYILANEKTFSAASVFVAAFKGLPNIQIVGVTTDGSSGNSEWFDLPNSKLFGKMSTMVSFQKDGQILDGYGTKPDIVLERDLDQLLWKSDSQLEALRSMILMEE